MNHVIDLRSDTVTRPTPEMREAMYEAEVGDDVYGEDPTVNRLEALAAEMAGKEAALFLPSGTMANQVAVMTHTCRGDEVLLEAEAHIFYYEAGGVSLVSGCQPRTVAGNRGRLTAGLVQAALRPPNVHFPPTTLVCLENTHNRGGGSVMPLEDMKAIFDLARREGISVHLDGARIFNAATVLGVNAGEIARYADSVMFCLSKGLAAPAGSMLAGDAPWIARARRNRKVLGGGMRQAGVLAAAGIVALTTMIERLQEDHENAKALALGLACIPGVQVNVAHVETNIVSFFVKDAPGWAQRSKEAGVLCNAMGPGRVRMVTHKDVSSAGIQEALRRIRAFTS
ncbi:MAG: low-specificity L-threonine aldolase [Bacillota bacterium]